MKAKCFWWSLFTGIEKRAVVRSIDAYQVSEYVLLCSSNEVTSGMVAAIGTTTTFEVRDSTYKFWGTQYDCMWT